MLHREFLAYCNIEIENLKLLEPKSKLINAIVPCLYRHISDITDIATHIQELKEQASKKIKDLEQSRSKILGSLPKSMLIKDAVHDDYSEQNQALLVTLNKEDEIIEKTQETALQLSKLLKIFQLKVVEQESISFGILQNAESSVVHMKTANYHLNSANERSKGMEKVWIIFFLTITLILIFYDWWTSRIVYTAD